MNEKGSREGKRNVSEEGGKEDDLETERTNECAEGAKRQETTG